MKIVSIIKVFIIGIVLSSLLTFPFILDVTLTPRFLALAICIALSLYYLYESEFTPIIKPDIILLFYTGFTAVCCISAFWANTKSEALFESSKQVLGFLVFLLTYFSLKKDPGYFIKTLLKFSVILFLIAIFIGGYQFSSLKNFNKESIYLITGLSGHKNLFASFLFLNLFFLISACYKLDTSWKIIAGISIVLNCVVLFLLKTKAVWLGLIVVITVCLFLYLFSLIIKTSKAKIRLSVFLVAALLITNVFFLHFLQPLIHKSIDYTSLITSSSAEESKKIMKLEEERLILWDKTYELIKQKPLLGVGIGNWQIYLPDASLSGLWRAEDLNYTFQRPHNDFLWILSETGIIGLNLFLVFLFALLFFLARTLRLITHNKSLSFEIILCAAFIGGYFTISFFDFPKERIEHTVWINILLGISYFHIKNYNTLKKIGHVKFNKLFSFVLILVTVAICLTGFMRLNGEFFTRRMYIYKERNRLKDLISAGNSATSFAYSIDPTSVPISWYIGNAQATVGNYEEAQKDFIQAYGLNPFNRNVLNDLASSYVFTNNVILAKQYYEEAARISPRFDDPKLNLAAMYINAKDFKTASFWLESLKHNSERRSNYEKIVELNKEN